MITNKEKPFDCIKMKNQIQAQVYAETKNMNKEELLHYFNKSVKQTGKKQKEGKRNQELEVSQRMARINTNEDWTICDLTFLEYSNAEGAKIAKEILKYWERKLCVCIEDATLRTLRFLLFANIRVIR